MRNNDHPTSLRDAILGKIQSGTVTMKPKWHFILRAMLLATGIALVALTLLYLASFILFMLRKSGVFFVPIFGPRGWFVLLGSLPWLLILLLIVFIIVLEILVRRYSFGYRRPLLYSVVGILLLVVIGGHIVARTSFHRRLMRDADRQHLPFAGPMYRRFGHPRFVNIHRGTITETMMPQRFMMNAEDQALVTVVITPRTRLPLGADFSIGDMVVVFGDRHDNTIQAFGVRIINDEPIDR